jgi:miniconductance mechanosensitive channel
MEQWLLDNLGSDGSHLSGGIRLVIVLCIIVVSFIAYFIVKYAVIPVIQKIVKQTETQWDDILLSERVCRSFSHIVPPVIMLIALPYALKEPFEGIVVRLLQVYVIYAVCYFISAFMRGIFDIFVHVKEHKAGSLKGILQTSQIIVWFVGIILMVSTLMGRSPLYLITGLLSASVVMMLIFQDTIKGLVAGIQLAINDMVRVDDWITIPARGVNGIVTEMTLSTVKIQNFDQTILTVQPYTLLSETFQNWRGMRESGGRCFQRGINVDVDSVKFLDASQVTDYQQKGYLPSTSQAGEATNLEAYRGAILKYLSEKPEINSRMTLMVRHLPQTAEGIPVQIYAFSTIKKWEDFEEIQARMLEYMLARASEFGIRPYQRRSDRH